MNKKPLPDSQFTETEIANYLAQNPDFFDRHGEALLKLRLQHPSGQAVSLIEKQVSALRERNTELRHKLNHLLDNARENDRLFERSKRLVLALLECLELGDAVDVLYYSFDKEFNIPYTRLILFSEPDQPSNTHTVSLDAAKVHLGHRLNANRATIGGLSRDEMDFLFGKDSKAIGSAAMAPLYYNRWLGVLAVGHPDTNHYQLGMGTLFLTHIAEVLDRLLPYFLNLRQR
jgi:uncharacterized protein YigA (DUF484 family)